MSLILEALKKSEQQRRLGEAPTLGSPVVSTRRRRSVLPALAALIVIAGGVAWWLTRPPAPSPAAPATPITAEKGPASSPGTAKPVNPAKPAPSTAAVPTMQERLLKEAAARKAAQARRVEALGNAKPNAPLGLPNTSKAPAAGISGRKLGDPLPMTPPVRNAAPPQGTAASGAAARNPSVKADATTATKPGALAPPASATAPGSARTTATAPPKAAAPAAAPAAAALPTIWELPFSTRKDIPAIDLSMHVYSANPKERFVVIKGERHVEGDEIGEDLTLREIRQDGLVLEFKGQAFFFPRSGR